MNFVSKKPSHKTTMFLEIIQMVTDFRSRDNVMILPLSYHLKSA